MSDSLISGIMVKTSVKELQKSLIDLNDENKKLQKTNVRLVIATSFLAFIQTIVAIVSLNVLFQD